MVLFSKVATISRNTLCPTSFERKTATAGGRSRHYIGQIHLVLPESKPPVSKIDCSSQTCPNGEAWDNQWSQVWRIMRLRQKLIPSSWIFLRLPIETCL
ncbi:hypothetical protein TNCV_2541321 [Trichonephila clavipes]|nr:hypothetical protein TNCV_2541321 [Trichonephila clavipes]